MINSISSDELVYSLPIPEPTKNSRRLGTLENAYVNKVNTVMENVCMASVMGRKQMIVLTQSMDKIEIAMRILDRKNPLIDRIDTHGSVLTSIVIYLK